MVKGRISLWLICLLAVSVPGLFLSSHAAAAQVIELFSLDTPSGPYQSRPHQYIEAESGKNVSGNATPDRRVHPRQSADEYAAISQVREHYLRGDFEEAMAQLQKLAKADPNNGMIHYYLGLTYQGMLRYPEAETSFARAAALSPADGSADTHLGEIRYRLGKYPEALTALETGSAKGVRSAYIAYMKGLVLIELADYAGSIAALQQAIALDPEYTQKATYAMGVAYSKQQDNQAARKAFEDAISMNAGAPAGVYSRLSLQSLNQPKKRPLHLDFGYGIHYDDNVVLKPGPAVSAVFPSGQRDFVHVLTLHARYEPEFHGAFAIRADGSYYKSIHNKLSGMDVDGTSLSLTPRMKTSAGEFSVEGRTDYYWVGRKRYLNIIGIYPRFNFFLNSSNFGIVHAGYISKQFLQQPLNFAEDRDAINSSGGYTHYIYSKDHNAYLALDYTFDTDNTRGNNWSYTGHQWSVAALYPLGNSFGLRFNSNYYLQNYRNIHTVFAQKRRDRTLTFAPVITYDMKWANLLLQYTHVRAQSNIAVYRYSRNITGMGVEYHY